MLDIQSVLDFLKDEEEEIKVEKNHKWLDLSYEEVDGVCNVCHGEGLVVVDEIDKKRGPAMIDNKIMEDGKGGYTYKEVIKQRCNCVLKKEAVESFERRIKKSGLAEQLRTKTFKTFKRETKLQKEMYDLCYNFVQEPKGMLALLGGTGSGKTHLGTAVVGNLVYKGYNAYYVEWKKEMSLAQDNYQAIDSDKLEKWTNTDVLYIDDLFKNKSNDVNAIKDKEFEYAWELLDARLKRNKITIISSEFTIHDFVRIDPSTAGRIVEMAGDNIINISNDIKNNYRLKNVL